MLQHLKINILGMNLDGLFGTISTIVLFCYNFAMVKSKEKMLGKWSELFQKKMEQKSLNSSLAFLQKPTFYAIVETFIISFAQYWFVGNINFAFGNLVGTGANYFGILFAGPILVSIVCWLLRIDRHKQLDLIIPAYPLALCFVKLACFSCGCCRGIQTSFGLYNYLSQRTEFPVQLIESALALLIFFFLQYYKKKAKTGTMYPIYMILYSGTRFFSEFLRREPNVLGILKIYHLLCIMGVLIGTILYVIIYRKKLDLRESNSGS